MDDHAWQRLLGQLVVRLSIEMRNCYPHILRDEPPPNSYERWQWINEQVHVASQELLHRIDGNVRRYSDEACLDILSERAVKAQTLEALITSMTDVLPPN